MAKQAGPVPPLYPVTGVVLSVTRDTLYLQETDSDIDGMPDRWELAFFGGITHV